MPGIVYCAMSGVAVFAIGDILLPAWAAAIFGACAGALHGICLHANVCLKAHPALSLAPLGAACCLWLHHTLQRPSGVLSLSVFVGLLASIAFFAGHSLNLFPIPVDGPSKRTTHAMVLWASLYALINFFQQWLLYYNFQFDYFDIGGIAHAFENTLRGEFFQNALLGDTRMLTRFAGHTELIYVAVLPLYALLPHPMTLIAIQSVAIGASIMILYKYLSMKFDQSCAVMGAASFSFFPALQLAGIFNFHADVLAIPFLLLFLYYYERRLVRNAFLALVAALACKEYVALSAAGFGAALMLDVKNRKSGAAILLLSVFWFAAALVSQNILRPDRYQALFSVQYAHLYSGGAAALAQQALENPRPLLDAFFSESNMHNLLFLFGPTLFLFIGYPPVFIIAFLPLLKDMMVGLSIGNHRLAAFLPFLWYGVFEGIRRIDMRFRLVNTHRLFLSLLAGSFLFGAALAEAPWSQRFYRSLQTKYLPSSRGASLRAAIRRVPAHVSASVTTNVFPYMVNRDPLYLFPVIGKGMHVDYILLDCTYLSPRDYEAVRRLIADRQYIIEYQADHVLLLRRQRDSRFDRAS